MRNAVLVSGDMVRWKEEQGSTLVEAALVMLSFLMLLFGIFDAGRLYFIYNSLSNAVREGTRYAVVHGGESYDPATEEEIKNVIVDAAAGVDDALLRDQIEINWEDTTDKAPGTYVTITATYGVDLVFIPDVTLTVHSSMLIER